jgi:hypothetical protein
MVLKVLQVNILCLFAFMPLHYFYLSFFLELPSRSRKPVCRQFSFRITWIDTGFDP